MEIFDRIVLGQWLRNFLLACGVFFLLITVVTVLAGMGRTSVTFLQILQNFFYELPKWSTNVIPFSCLVATLFSIDRLRNRNELVSLYSLGYSPWRALIVITFAAGAISAFQFYNASFITPYFNFLRHQWLFESGANFKQEGAQDGQVSKKTEEKIWYKIPQGHMSFVAITERGDELREVELVYINDQKKIETIVVAERAIFKQNNLWEFQNAKIFKNLSGEGFPEVRLEESTSYTLLESPENIQKVFSDVSSLPLKALAEYIKNIKRTGVNASGFEVLFWEKYNAGVVCLLFALIPSVGLFSPGRRQTKVGAMIFMVVSFAALYYLFQSGLTTFAKNATLPPWPAVFGTTIFFALYLSAQLLFKRKL